MTTNKPKVVVYRYTASRSFGKRNRKWHYQESFPHASNREVAEIGQMEELIRLSDYQRLQADHERLQADHERLQAEGDKLRTCLAETAGVAVTMLYESHRQDTLKEFDVTELARMVDYTKHLADANVQVEKVYRKAWGMAHGCVGSYLEGVQP